MSTFDCAYDLSDWEAAHGEPLPFEDEDPADRWIDLAGELSAALESYVESVDAVGAAASEVARLERLYLAALAQAGIHDSRQVRGTCAELLLGRVCALSPHVALIVSERADRAADELENWSPPQELSG